MPRARSQARTPAAPQTQDNSLHVGQTAISQDPDQRVSHDEPDSKPPVIGGKVMPESKKLGPLASSGKVDVMPLAFQASRRERAA